MAMKIIQHETLDAPELKAAWDRVWDAAPTASPFNSWEWCACWRRHLGMHVRPVILQVIDEAGHTVGLAPFGIGGSSGVRWLRFLGRERASGDHLDVLTRPGMAEACLEAVLDHLEQMDEAFDGILLGELDPLGAALDSFIQRADRYGWPWREREHRAVPFLDLPASFDAYLASLSSNMRYHVRRRRRGLSRAADARLETVRGGDRVDAVLADFFALHQQRWAVHDLPGNFGEPAMQAFLREFCHQAGQRDWLRLHVLTVAGRTQCVQIMFHTKRTAYYYQMGWHPQSSIDSPGVVIMSHSIEQAVDEGLARYDFLRGDEQYKFRWTRWAAEQTTLAIGCRASARATLAAERLKDGLKAAVQQYLGPRRWEQARRLVLGRGA